MNRPRRRPVHVLNESREPHTRSHWSLGDQERVVYYLRCGWCGAYEGTVDPTEPCARDHDTGEYIGPHQFEVYERKPSP